MTDEFSQFLMMSRKPLCTKALYLSRDVDVFEECGPGSGSGRLVTSARRNGGRYPPSVTPRGARACQSRCHRGDGGHSPSHQRPAPLCLRRPLALPPPALRPVEPRR